MHREIHQWYSPRLEKPMEVAIYGHYGFALLMLPTAAADFLEYERFHLIGSIAPWIEAGKVKVFSVNSINAEAWLNDYLAGWQKSLRHDQFNGYITEEVVPFIRNATSWDTPIITCGASLGALHSANLFFRRPDLFAGVIALSGIYDLAEYAKGHWDDRVYFNSPTQYLPNLHDDFTLQRLRQAWKIIIASGSGDYEAPDAARYLSQILHQKGIGHDLDIWGGDMRHDWPTWRAMLPHFLDTRF